MARAALPHSKLKMRKRRRRLRIALLAALLFLALLGGCVALLRAPFWRIMHISVSGTQSVAPEALEGAVFDALRGSYWYVLPKNNTLLYPKSALISSLKARFPALSSIVVTRKGFAALQISVAEYGPYALWCGQSPQAAEPCLLVDKEGIAYAPGVVSQSAYARYYGPTTGNSLPKRYLAPGQFAQLTAFLSQLSQTVGTVPTSVAVDQNDDVRVQFSNGFMLLYSMHDDAAKTLGRFALALTAAPFKGRALSSFEYLDLRFGDKLYYKLKNE